MVGLEAKSFQADEARFYGHLFENPQVGVPRDVYWALEVEFQPIAFSSDEWVSSLSVEWIEWPVRNWEELDGCEVCLPSPTAGAEASLYLFSEHQPVKSLRVNLRRLNENRFEIRFTADLDIVDPEGTVIRDFELKGSTEGEFEGIVVVKDNLFPKPDTPAAALNLLEPFADLSSYETPTFDRFRWVIAPKIR